MTPPRAAPNWGDAVDELLASSGATVRPRGSIGGGAKEEVALFGVRDGGAVEEGGEASPPFFTYTRIVPLGFAVPPCMNPKRREWKNSEERLSALSRSIRVSSRTAYAPNACGGEKEGLRRRESATSSHFVTASSRTGPRQGCRGAPGGRPGGTRRAGSPCHRRSYPHGPPGWRPT